LFQPETSLLNTIDALKNVDHTITYEQVDELTMETITYPVTVVANENNTTISTDSGRIVGYYTDPFDITVTYLNNAKQSTTVESFSDINVSDVYELYNYTPNTQQQKTYTYTAIAYDETPPVPVEVARTDYTIVVTNNWTYGRNQLLKYANLTRYQNEISVSWTNQFGQPIPMINNSGKQITWENNS
jgi:hypothetical protein